MLEQLPTVGLNAEAIAPRIEYYRSLGVPRLGRFLSRHPPLLAYSLEANVQPKAGWLSRGAAHGSTLPSPPPSPYSRSPGSRSRASATCRRC